MLVLAAIAIPVELRPLGRATLGFSIGALDVAENIAGFGAVGVVLAELGFLRATMLGALISILAEGSQFFMVHRDPSAIDVVSNTVGTMVGAFIGMRWSLHSPGLRIGKWKAGLATAMAAALIFGIWASSGDAVNPRGVTSPGALEAYWKLDEGSGRLALDSSGHKLHGLFRNQPRRVAGVRGGAVTFDGVRDYIDAGHSSAFRLAGSMTISAWINSSFFPKDDAAIVSQFQNGFGYQLDTTVDKGIRGIGFKLTNSCGDLMARYGAAPLATGLWYHVAGVYDAEARTLDVYLNGKPDNGILAGTVTGRQHSSRSALYIGRRSDLDGFGFAGSIDEVRIYSFALSNEEIVADMHGEVIQHTAARNSEGHPGRREPACAVSSEYGDSKIPLAAAMVGVLVAIGCIGFWPSGGTWTCLVASYAAGLLLLPLMAPSMPLLSRWMMPLVSFAGGVAIAASLRR